MSAAVQSGVSGCCPLTPLGDTPESSVALNYRIADGGNKTAADPSDPPALEAITLPNAVNEFSVRRGGPPISFSGT